MTVINDFLLMIFAAMISLSMCFEVWAKTHVNDLSKIDIELSKHASGISQSSSMCPSNQQTKIDSGMCGGLDRIVLEAGRPAGRRLACVDCWQAR